MAYFEVSYYAVELIFCLFIVREISRVIVTNTSQIIELVEATINLISLTKMARLIYTYIYITNWLF